MTRLAETVVDRILTADPWFEAWLSPSGKYIRAQEGHIKWAIKNVLNTNEWKKDEHGQIVGVYAAMKRRGWVRVVRQGTLLIADLYRASDAQRAELEAIALEDGYTVADEKAR